MNKFKRFKTALIYVDIHTFDDDLRAVNVIFCTLLFKQKDQQFF